MIKILVNKERYYDEDLEDRDFNVKAEFSLPEDADTYSAAKMFADAMVLEGYFPISIINAFKDYCEKYSDDLIESDKED